MTRLPQNGLTPAPTRMPLGLYFILEKTVRNECNPMVGSGKRVEAVGYMRTSSATNVRDGKDGEARQRKAIEDYAEVTGMAIIDWFYDAAVSGADPIEARPGFAALPASQTMAPGRSSSKPQAVLPETSWFRKFASPCCRTWA